MGAAAVVHLRPGVTRGSKAAGEFLVSCLDPALHHISASNVRLHSLPAPPPPTPLEQRAVPTFHHDCGETGHGDLHSNDI